MRLKKVILYYCIIVSIVLFIDGIYVFTGFIGWQNPGSVKEQNYSGGGSVHNESSIFAGEPINILLLGLDEEEVRSDVILLLNLRPADGSLNMLSIARDTKVRINGKTAKINALIGMGGEKLIAGKVAEITGLTINYYLTMNFKGFRKIIDTLGGVQVEIPFNMNYDDPVQNLHIHLTAGKQVLDGEKAEQFVRYRKGNGRTEGYSDGDLGRIKAQQILIKELVAQKLKLRYFLKVDDIYHILKQYMKTNIGIDDINHYYSSIGNIRLNNIKTFALPGDSAYIGNLWYFIYNPEKTRDLIEQNFYK
jgi:polyisoprenyl-teichoic acid--peptidoglycan teichoic acid transferase